MIDLFLMSYFSVFGALFGLFVKAACILIFEIHSEIGERTEAMKGWATIQTRACGGKTLVSSWGLCAGNIKFRKNGDASDHDYKQSSLSFFFCFFFLKACNMERRSRGLGTGRLSLIEKFSPVL